VKRVVLVAVLLLAGCGGSEERASIDARVYFLRDDKVWPVARTLDSADAVSSALDELFAGPNVHEREALGATTAIPGGGPSVSIEDGVATLESPQGQFSREALAQIVYTLTGLEGIRAVDVGKLYTRSDFEEQTPTVLVESPLPFAEVTSPLEASGTANTFEATFNYELLDSDGSVVDENFVTATSGTGTRGTFDFTTGDFEEAATLRVFEISAEDGSRTREVEIPLRTAQ
jgi:hypothetical protein